MWNAYAVDAHRKSILKQNNRAVLFSWNSRQIFDAKIYLVFSSGHTAIPIAKWLCLMGKFRNRYHSKIAQSISIENTLLKHGFFKHFIPNEWVLLFGLLAKNVFLFYFCNTTSNTRILTNICSIVRSYTTVLGCVKKIAFGITTHAQFVQMGEKKKKDENSFSYVRYTIMTWARVST